MWSTLTALCFGMAALLLVIAGVFKLVDPSGSVGALRALGVRLAIDDYGTGYSTLAALPLMPVDTLKIDPSFFREGEHNRVLVRVVAELARGLGLDVTAEGVETAAAVAWARAAGCALGQGYFFARPLPAEECEAWWEAGLRYGLPGEGRDSPG